MYNGRHVDIRTGLIRYRTTCKEMGVIIVLHCSLLDVIKIAKEHWM